MASRTRKRTPYDPSKAYDVRDKEKLRKLGLATWEVDDPYQQGAKILAMRAIRKDPLADLHSREHIDDAQYEGGRAFQRDFEAAERGPGAIDYGKEHVDGGITPEPITESQRRAAKNLAKAFRELGKDGTALMHDFLVDGCTMTQIAYKRGMRGRTSETYYGVRVRECLHCLAFVYGFAKEPAGRVRIPGKGT